MIFSLRYVVPMVALCSAVPLAAQATDPARAPVQCGVLAISFRTPVTAYACVGYVGGTHSL